MALQANEQERQAVEESSGLKAKLGCLVLGEITNSSDAEQAVTSTLFTIGGLKDDCAQQKAALEVHQADLKSTLLAKGGAPGLQEIDFPLSGNHNTVQRGGGMSSIGPGSSAVVLFGNWREGWGGGIKKEEWECLAKFISDSDDSSTMDQGVKMAPCAR